MKRISLLSLLFIILITSPAQALSWAYPFVVWKAKVYEVKQEEIIKESEVGKIIGEVKTQPNHMTGNYYGNTSNHYPIGTKYYEIKGTSASSEIAIEEDGRWVKAVYAHYAPFHMMNLFSNIYFIGAAVIIALIIIRVIYRTNRKKLIKQ